MTRIKICGITSAADAAMAIEAGADALGFILVPGTPRYVGDRADLPMLLGSLPPFITRVAVVAEIGIDPLLHCFDAVQTYTPIPSPDIRSIYAARVRDAADLDGVEQALAAGRWSALLLDAHAPGALGGTGLRFPWAIAREAAERFNPLPVLMAGGLTPQNVGDAVREVRPYGVDVSSGVEAAPGRKDPAAVRDFILAVREADRAG